MSFYLFLQSIEVINDDSNKQVQGEERTDNYEHDEIEIRNKTVLAFRLIINLKKKRKIRINIKLSKTDCPLWKRCLLMGGWDIIFCIL